MRPLFTWTVRWKWLVTFAPRRLHPLGMIPRLSFSRGFQRKLYRSPKSPCHRFKYCRNIRSVNKSQQLYLFTKLPSTLADLKPGKLALVQGTLLWRVTAYVFIVKLRSFRKKRRRSRYTHCEVLAAPSRFQSSGMWLWFAGQIIPDIFKVKQSKKRQLDLEEDGDATLRLVATTQLHIP